ncbi:MULTISPECIES: DUF4157 domain-containing protein [Streptomyces]|uniref:eCIS core domain-containing protein n=1 Tax=Streptomyces alboflavus TaxID=67267 RepID=A0A1Z1WLK2_9ACTN|nr:DUF4157 domain-containing protein [Streptomyces alboflavus]ARX87316.1 hypothetical protein SMD44_06797 [Streptomyces alboflavus]
MHAHGTQAKEGGDQGKAHRPGPAGPHRAPGPATTAGRILSLQRLAGNAAVSRAVEEERHAHGPGCGHGQTEPSGEQPVMQRQMGLSAALASPGAPLEPRIRERAEQAYGMNFGDVRKHDGPEAQQSAREFGALAYTVGPHIVAAEPNLPDDVMFHELGHRFQNAMGPVAGTDDGSGVRVSSPGDPFELQADSNGKKIARGEKPDLSLPGRPAPAGHDTDDEG